MPICSNCGQDNPEGFRLCGMCGAPLAAPVRPRELRKTVTLLFTDVTSSTALGERLDPESLRRVMTRYFVEMRAVIERHGGTVEKFVGDAVMAVFGIPVVHEDDALRAVRASVEMREALAALNEELARERGVTIEVRTGVNTGEVIAGDAASGQSFATGDATNVAARLEQAAAPGDILIGETTYRLVRDAVKTEPAGALHIKGKADGVRALRLLSVTPGAAGHARRLDSPMVGRRRERKRLRDAFDHAAGDRACHLFTVLGAAGVGKSRLVAEFCNAVASETTLVRGRCLPYGDGITFWPLGEVVRELAAIEEDDSPEDGHRKLTRLLDDTEEADQIAERVAGLIGLADARAGTDESFWAVRKLFEAASRRRPLVVVFDDIHWAEPAFLDLVEHVADLARDAPMLLLCVARPELLDVRPGWGGGKLNATSVLLEPLDSADGEQLIQNLLGGAELAPVVRRRITDAAEGNPLFVEELIGMLIDDGLLRRANGAWVSTADLSQLAVPPTIQVLIAARLDRLEADERAVVERASVEGKLFHRGSVAELSPEGERPAVGARLLVLVRKELIRPDRSMFAGDDAFRFRHLLIRDAAYDALPKESRAELHERFAAWLEQRAGERLTEFEEILGYHLEQAYRYRVELGPADAHALEVARVAARRLGAAGRRAYGRGDAAAACKLLERAAALLPEHDRERLGIEVVLGAALFDAGDLARADHMLRTVVDGARRAGDRPAELRGSIELVRQRSLTDPEGGKIDELERVSNEAIAVFEPIADHGGLARAWHGAAFVNWHRARCAAHLTATERACQHARLGGDESFAMLLTGWIAISLFRGPMPVDEAIPRCRDALERYRGHPTIEVSFRLALANLLALTGRFNEARDLCARAREVAAELESVQLKGAAAQFSSFVELQGGNLQAAERLIREQIELLERAGDKGFLSTSAGYLAHMLYRQGRYAEAEEYTRLSEEYGASDDASTQLVWRAGRAAVLARRGQAEGARALAEQALVIARETDTLVENGDACLLVAETFTLTGDRAKAVAAGGEALRLYRQKGSTSSLEAAAAKFAELGLA